MATKQNLSDKKIILQREFGVISSTAYVVGNIIDKFCKHMQKR